MKKISSLFQRSYDGDRLVRNEIVPGAEWAAAGEGIATRKHDGTCCMVRGGKLWKRYDAKQGKTPPTGFEAAQEPDTVTGHYPGWLPVGEDAADQWHCEAWNAVGVYLQDGTYELIGPKIQGNQEGRPSHTLIRHGCEVLNDAPRTFEEIKAYLGDKNIEGIVWHHPDGRMVKIKKRDFGMKRVVLNERSRGLEK